MGKCSLACLHSCPAHARSDSDEEGEPIKSYAVSQGIASSRLTTEGRGETEAIADNTSESGKAQNRRVEIVIVANEAMKAEAKNN